MDRDQAVEQLANNFDETRTALGVASNGALLEVFSSPGGTWSILLTVPRGPSCLVASGSDWNTLPVSFSEEPAI